MLGDKIIQIAGAAIFLALAPALYAQEAQLVPVALDGETVVESYSITDMAHGTHPNYPDRHEPNHWIALGGGPVVKTNLNQRYATDGATGARFRLACERAGVPVQEYSHRNDLPCGSTIGPITAARLGVPTLDVGMAQLSMHSIRELMASADVALMVRAFEAWLVGAP